MNFLCYTVAFQNFEGVQVEVNIFDMETFSEGAEVQILQLKPSGEPAVLECIDNDEDKFTAIRAKQLIIQFNSSNKYDSNFFARGEDSRWYVELFLPGTSEFKFKGYIVMNDIQESFLSPPNVVTLVATDGIGLLKDIPLVNFDNVSPITVRPKNKYRWIDYLGWALRKTGLNFPINIQHNLREENNEDDPFWSQVYLDPKTFEDEIGTCVSCYEVLERLLGKDCFVTQYNSEWWVIRVDEIDSRDRKVWHIESDLSSWTLVEGHYDKTIKKDLDIKWIERSAYVVTDRPHAKVKESFNFDPPKELIDNISFDRGDQILVEVLPTGQRHYHLLDWDFDRYPTATTASSAYIRRLFNEFDIEKERYVVITASAGAGNTHALFSSRIPMLEKDKFTFSVDRRLELNISGSGFYRTAVAQIRLYAVDNTYYVLAGKVTVGGNIVPSNWVVTDVNFSLNADYVWYEGDVKNDDREWHGVNEEVPPIPKDGEIEILLLQTADVPLTSETHFANLNLAYYQYINGTYQKYNGQYWQVSQEGDYKAKREDQVFVSDGTRPVFKGAMQYFDFPVGRWFLTGNWFDWSLTTTPAAEDYKPFGWYQAQAVWNQYNREMKIFDGELLGLTENDFPDLIHRYILGDPSLATRLRYFMCLHFSMSLKTCRWTAHFAELFKTDEEKVYTDTTEFKYIESR